MFICLTFSSERGGGGFSAIAQNPEFMAAIGKSFANQTAAVSRMVEDSKEELEYECSSCHFVMTEENISYSDNTCPHCGSTMYRQLLTLCSSKYLALTLVIK